MVDCIYIDPPYNSGARDWKYNNDYVDSKDKYPHSKWLAMMESRLLLAKKLLNPNSSVLIITIDEKEYLHLGCLLKELFPEANIQMVTSVISGKGVSREGQFSRVEEYLFFVSLGNMPILQLDKNMLNDSNKESIAKNNVIDFLGFRRRNKGNYRTSRPNQFYPVIVDNEDGHIVSIGDAITPDINRHDVNIPDGCTGLWPLDPSGSERIWSVVPDTARNLLEKGYLKVINWKKDLRKGSVKYLADGMVQDINNGVIIIDERDQYGAVISGHYVNDEDNTLRPKRVWHDPLHNASSYGTLLVKKFLGEKRFDFPKSLYAVHDSIRFLLAEKKNALVLDFFAGSGTTLHAVNLLNKEDGGHRRCIMVTNNEVSADEEISFRLKGLHKGDEEWEKFGIARYVNWPRTKCSIEGVDVNGQPINGEYITCNSQEITQKRSIKQLSIDIPDGGQGITVKKQIVALINDKNMPQNSVTAECPYIVKDDATTAIIFDLGCIDDFLEDINEDIETIYVVTANNKAFKEAKRLLDDLPERTKIIPVTIPMSDGFKTNAAFYKLTFLDKESVSIGTQLDKLLSILWMKAGAHGVCPVHVEGEYKIFPENRMAILIDEYGFDELKEGIAQHPEIETVYIIDDSEDNYRALAAQINVKSTYQLYRDYLDNFKINIEKR